MISRSIFAPLLLKEFDSMRSHARDLNAHRCALLDCSPLSRASCSLAIAIATTAPGTVLARIHIAKRICQCPSRWFRESNDGLARKNAPSARVIPDHGNLENGNRVPIDRFGSDQMGDSALRSCVARMTLETPPEQVDASVDFAWVAVPRRASHDGR
jgi:hypothetical protein